ncbi:MAG: hypothetical protein J6W81_01325 [Lentisphaeria bacterium]|nr:hypothetical protein [Lentisphaeria bacterium]
MKHTVIHAGYPGDSSRAMLKRIENDVLRHKPDTVIIECGANDAVNPAALTTVEEYTSNLKNMAYQIEDIGADILFVTSPPVYAPEMIVRYKFPQSPDTELNPILDQYVDAMRSVARFLNRPLVDMSRILKTVGKVGPEKESLIRNQANSGVIDGAHLTAEGYRLLAVTVYQALLDNHLAGRRIVCFGDSITHGYPLAGMGTLEGDNYPAVLSRLLNQDCGEEE